MKRFPTNEVWLAEQGFDRRAGRGECDNCGKVAQLWGDAGRGERRDLYCDRCVGYSYGYDQAEHAMLNVLLGGAIGAVLGDHANQEEVMAAVSNALEDHHDRQAASMRRIYEGVA